MIVLDTHVMIWWLSNPEKLSKRANSAIAQGVDGKEIYVSSISTWEMAMLVARGRLDLTMDVRDWISAAESLPFLHFIPVSNNIAIKSVQLPEFKYDDPADKIIIATTVALKAVLITKDSKILEYPHVKTLW